MTGDTRDHQTQLTSSSPLSDLRHVTSNPALLSASPPRQPQQLTSLTPNSSRGGSRSPTSIPSSPTSIRSSSSAIFERDIEPLPSASLLPHQNHHPTNPHRTPRSKATEQLEHSVPSVLTEAANALAASGDGDIAVIAPAPVPTPLSLSESVGSRSPPPRSRSPSPSPPSHRTNLPVSTSANTSPVSGRSHLAVHRTTTSPHPPGGFSSPSRSPIPSPTTAVATTPPPIPDAIHASPAHQKRLSFISYSDLLASTPITALPLSSFTAPHSAVPPPHLPAVSAAATVSPTPSQGAPSRPLSTYSISTGMSGGGGRGGGLGEEQQGVSRRLMDDIGGEWEREGLGKGLEERLEELMVGKA